MNALILFIIGIPLIEIYLMIKVGGVIGAFNTIFLIFFTAITGIFFARLEGLNTIKSGFNQLIKNEIPVYEIISGATLAFAALLLIIPGFLTDIIGFLLIIPITRKIFIKAISSKFSKRKINEDFIEGDITDNSEDNKNGKDSQLDYKILSKFIKDISFEIPNIETFTMLQKEISKYNLNFDIKSKPFKKNIIEVNTILKLIPPEEIKHKMLTEINMCALISLENVNDSIDKKELEKIVLIKVPTDIYPTLYETFIYLFKQAGVDNISIAKEVNFEKMYKEKFSS